MTDIFISHATKDKHLAEKLVDLLKEGIGVPNEAIFCSSLDGHGIPFGEDFNAYMKEQIQEPKLVLLLMTPAYMESWFCLMEVGAAWSQSHRSLAIVVPPIKFSVVTSTLGLKQAWDITHHPGLIDLRKMVQDSGIILETRSEHTWDKKRTDWKSALKQALKKLVGPSTVSADTYQEVLERIIEQEDEIGTLQELLEDEKKKVAALIEAKDADAVETILSGFQGSDDLQAQFEVLLEAVVDARPKQISDAVFKHVIMDHYDKAAAINWYRADKEDFEEAIKRGVLSAEEGTPVDWNRSKLNKLEKALKALDHFLDFHPDFDLRAIKKDDDIPIEADDLEFWEYHLDN
ncbi:toll/interleukin-1 receptor domain-containing protein [Loktanella sp. R86503]|uniref:toll/interleukin-1 receptor domain-containing protein n=1 Tax=Loktanella sp. R86503 TaxID=3093847 RepID=UPI0036D845C9